MLEHDGFCGVATLVSHGLYLKSGGCGLPDHMGGDERIRTADAAFAEPCLTTWRRRLEWERETGIEPATFSLARRCSTTEPLPRDYYNTAIPVSRPCLHDKVTTSETNCQQLLAFLLDLEATPAQQLYYAFQPVL